MGGRGSASGVAKAGSVSGGGKSTKSNSLSAMNTKFSTKEISKMSRRQLEIAARAVFVKQNVAKGLSATEADRRASLLMSGNTDAQLRKYIKRNG